jgi:hypothetical protein
MERRGKHTSSATCYRDFDHDGSLFAKLYTIDFDANESAVESSGVELLPLYRRILWVRFWSAVLGVSSADDGIGHDSCHKPPTFEAIMAIVDTLNACLVGDCLNPR